MTGAAHAPLTGVIGWAPYRLALSGGWIDQPFVSTHNPDPPGSMVVVSLVPNVRFMERAGMATGTRKAMLKLWPRGIPDRPLADLVRELYYAENEGRPDPSGSQDMIGLLYPGISRLDYDVRVHGGVFPAHVETVTDLGVCHWLESVVHLIPVCQRPPGYNPLDVKRISPAMVASLGHSGRACFEAILAQDTAALGKAFNDTMECWRALLPCVFEHPTLELDLWALLRWYQSRYPGAGYSGCGGGYLVVISEQPVPGAFRCTIRCA